MEKEEGEGEEMWVEEKWGLRSPTPRGRTESCTLRILRMLFTGAHGKKEGKGEKKERVCEEMWVGEEWGLTSPPHWQSCAVGAHWPPATKSEHRERTGHCGVATLSCTLRILRMLFTGAHGKKEGKGRRGV